MYDKSKYIESDICIEIARDDAIISNKVIENALFTKDANIPVTFLNAEDFTFRNCFFLSIDFDLCTFAGALFEDCIFENVNFKHSELSGANFVSCNFVSAEKSEEQLKSIKTTAAYSSFVASNFKYCNGKFIYYSCDMEAVEVYKRKAAFELSRK